MLEELRLGTGHNGRGAVGEKKGEGASTIFA